MVARGVATYAIDAGGSHTTVRVRHRDGTLHGWDRPSCSIAAVGRSAAAAGLRRVLAEVHRELDGEGPLLGCLASSSFPVAGEAATPRALLEAVLRSQCRGRAIVVNDVVPLLWAPPVGGHGIVVNSGTGSAVIGLHRDGTLVKLGGHEHILSDQGSAYSLAREGLRAATRAVDGLGPGTRLTVMAEEFYGRTLPELGRWLAELGRARSQIARFAPRVDSAARQGDPVAAAITDAESAALGRAAVAAVERLGLGRRPAVGLGGGVLRGSPQMRAGVVAALARAGLEPSTGVVDSVSATLEFAGRAGGEGSTLLDAVGGLAVTVAPGAGEPG